MKPSDFLIVTETPPGPNAEPWDWGQTTTTVNVDLLTALRRGPLGDGRSDLTVAIALAEFVRDDLTSYGTGQVAVASDDEMREALRALTAVCRRLGVSFEVPYRDLETWRSYWIKQGAAGHGGYQARRDLLEPVFEPLLAGLYRREDLNFEALTHPISPRSSLGWSDVDQEIHEMRRRFESAATTQDYRDVGLRAVAILEALSAVVFNPNHLDDGEKELPVDKTKARIGRYVERTCPGSEHAELRSLVTATVNYAQRIKHGSGNRRDAGLIADTVILLANLLRRLGEPHEGRGRLG